MSVYAYLHVGRAGELQDPGDRKLYRLLEILPGFSAWLTFILIVVLSFWTPFFVALFIIAFDVYWLIKTIYLSLHLRVAYNKLRENSKINWLERLENLQPTPHQAYPLTAIQKGGGLGAGQATYNLQPIRTFCLSAKCSQGGTLGKRSWHLKNSFDKAQDKSPQNIPTFLRMLECQS